MTEATAGAVEPEAEPTPEPTPEATPAPAIAAGLYSVAGVALVVGAGLTVAAYAGEVALLIAVAVVQALTIAGWVFGTSMPGVRGGFVVATIAAAGADLAVSLFPDGRLGVLVAVFGLTIPVAFVHQLLRGAARVQLVSSLSAVSVIVLAVIAMPALVQVRHEFVSDGALLGGALEGRVAAAVAGAAAAAVLTGALMDTVIAVPRFDPEVPRGVLGLVAATAVGAAVAHLLLREVTDFDDGRGAFLGAAIGALTGLLAVAASFVRHTTPRATTRLTLLARPLYGALLPMCVVAPAAFLLCLVIRS